MNTDNNSEDQTLINKGDKILRTKDLFEVLGVARDASDKEIKKAYRKVSAFSM